MRSPLTFAIPLCDTPSVNSTRRNQLSFVNRAMSMQDPESEEFREIAYWARVWVQASLPHSNPGKVSVWGRENGAFSLTVQPGVDIVNGQEVNHGIPYGSIPRLLMCWMCTEAVRTQEPQLFLGNSLSKFMRSIELGNATGGRWGNVARLKEQMNRLFQARISYRWRGGQLGQARKSIQITSEEVLWWSEKTPELPTLFKSYITLDDRFFNDIVANPVPIKLEALRLLKSSPLALDLYTWLTHRVFALRQEVAIPWKLLERQIGADYSSTENFARKCKAVLKRIQLVYPELKLETPTGRLVVKPSPTHVRRIRKH